MKHLNTTKLFYDKYKYRLVVQHTLGTIFRDKNLAHARQVLDNLQFQLEQGDELEWRRGFKYYVNISNEQLFSAQFLLHEFYMQGHGNYKLRCEHPCLMIYSNDLHWLNKMIDKGIVADSLTQPNFADVKELVPYVIVTDDDPIIYQYKVTVGSQVSPALADWIRANSDKCKAGTKFLHSVANNGYVNGMYFYVRDERVLQLVQIIIGGDIKRVDKFINSALS